MTILVPLAATVARLHGVGVAHGSLGVPAVRFDARGAPVLTGLEQGVRRSVVGDAAFPAAEAEDEAGLRALAVTVLRAAGPAAATLVAELAAGSLTAASLPAALFALAEPAPVRLEDRQPEEPGALEPVGRLLAPVAAAPQHAAGDRALAALPATVRRALDRAGRVLRGVRPRVWAAAAASLALLAGALVLLPGRGAAGAPEFAAPSPSRSLVATPRVRATATAIATQPVVAIPAEPLAAARALLAERRRCLALASARCLARIESAGSPVAIEDAASMAGAVEAVAMPEAGLRLRSAAGGTAVLTAGDRTVLLVREPHGWRLRDAIGPPTTRSTARSDGGGG